MGERIHMQDTATVTVYEKTISFSKKALQKIYGYDQLPKRIPLRISLDDNALTFTLFTNKGFKRDHRTYIVRIRSSYTGRGQMIITLPWQEKIPLGTYTLRAGSQATFVLGGGYEYSAPPQETIFLANDFETILPIRDRGVAGVGYTKTVSVTGNHIAISEDVIREIIQVAGMPFTEVTRVMFEYSQLSTALRITAIPIEESSKGFIVRPKHKLNVPKSPHTAYQTPGIPKKFKDLHVPKGRYSRHPNAPNIFVLETNNKKG